jgi:hypothetical protein
MKLATARLRSAKYSSYLPEGDGRAVAFLFGCTIIGLPPVRERAGGQEIFFLAGRHLKSLARSIYMLKEATSSSRARMLSNGGFVP